MDERELVARVLSGDQGAERVFYDAHVDRVYCLAYRILGSPELAEDCTQETFLRAFNRLDGFRGDAALSSWLHAVTLSVVHNHLRKSRRRREHEWVTDSPPDLAEGGSQDDPDLHRRLHKALDRLSDDLRVVVILHYIEGYKHLEMAEMLGIPEGTSKARLHRARQELQRVLEGPNASGPTLKPQTAGPAESAGQIG